MSDQVAALRSVAAAELHYFGLSLSWIAVVAGPAVGSYTMPKYHSCQNDQFAEAARAWPGRDCDLELVAAVIALDFAFRIAQDLQENAEGGRKFVVAECGEVPVVAVPAVRRTGSASLIAVGSFPASFVEIDFAKILLVVAAGIVYVRSSLAELGVTVAVTVPNRPVVSLANTFVGIGSHLAVTAAMAAARMGYMTG